MATVDATLALIRWHGAPDGALLNVQIKNGTSYPVADELHRRGVPLAFVTSLSRADVNPRFRAVPILAKRADVAAIAQALQR